MEILKIRLSDGDEFHFTSDKWSWNIYYCWHNFGIMNTPELVGVTVNSLDGKVRASFKPVMVWVEEVGDDGGQD